MNRQSMNRRQFTRSLAAAAALGTLGPIAASATERVTLHDTSFQSRWRCADDCLRDRGLEFSGQGPVDGPFELVDVIDRGNQGCGAQFIARFSGPIGAPEGVYRLRAPGRDLVLFLQPSTLTPGHYNAAISHVA